MNPVSRQDVIKPRMGPKKIAKRIINFLEGLVGDELAILLVSVIQSKSHVPMKAKCV
jgi:hypothetical protein